MHESKGQLRPQESMNGSSHSMPSLSNMPSMPALPAKVDSALKMDESHEEGTVTKAIENQTSKIPSGVFLGLAFGAMAIAAGLAATSEKKGLANFVGLWAPSLLMLGVYNKIVKTQGSDMNQSLK
jgi:hypothetical protein